MSGPKYPKVKVKLTGTDGNAFELMGRCSTAARAKGLTAEEIKAFTTEAMSGDYDNLLRTCLKWFKVS